MYNDPQIGVVPLCTMFHRYGLPPLYYDPQIGVCSYAMIHRLELGTENIYCTKCVTVNKIVNQSINGVVLML